MEIRHLRYFVAMAETGSLMKASERLHVAQPALSVHLSNLEAELGTTLVTRSNRGVELTPDGQFLYERALNILKYHQESISALKERKASPRGSVSIGMLSTMPALLVPALHRAVRDALPDVTLYIIDASTAAIYEYLMEGRIDMAMLFNLPDTPEFEAVPLFCEEYYVVGRPGPNDTTDEIEFEDILDLPLALPSASTTWRKALDDAAERRGKTLRPVIETESASALRALALEGDCYAVMPRSSIHEDVQAGRLHARKVVHPEMGGLMSVVSLSSRPLAPAQLRVRELLVETVRTVRETINLSEEASADAQIMRTMPSPLLPAQQARRRQLRAA